MTAYCSFQMIPKYVTYIMLNTLSTIYDRVPIRGNKLKQNVTNINRQEPLPRYNKRYLPALFFFDIVFVFVKLRKKVLFYDVSLSRESEKYICFPHKVVLSPSRVLFRRKNNFTTVYGLRSYFFTRKSISMFVHLSFVL